MSYIDIFEEYLRSRELSIEILALGDSSHDLVGDSAGRAAPLDHLPERTVYSSSRWGSNRSNWS